jgi:HAD superfamily hydrolase (TIGR01509 family)
MITPKVVVFDLGKVLLDFDYGIASRRIAARGNITHDQVRQFIDHSPLLFRFETGVLNNNQFFTEVCAATGFCGAFDEFSEFFSDIFVPIEPMVRLQQELRARGIPTYIFSNTNDLAIGHIRNRFPFFGNFDGYVFSYEHGCMKPDARLYEVIERLSGRRAAEILYLDDRPENVAAGSARGWQAILQETPEKTLAAIKSLGLLDGKGSNQ